MIAIYSVAAGLTAYTLYVATTTLQLMMEREFVIMRPNPSQKEGDDLRTYSLLSSSVGLLFIAKR